MPIYEYECKKCHHRFEKIQKFSDPHVKKCPECGGPIEQVVTAPAVQFKGSGWYVTDYAKKPGGIAKTASSESSNGDSSKSEPSSSSDKPETKESGGKKEKAKTETSAKKSEKK